MRFVCCVCRGVARTGVEQKLVVWVAGQMLASLLDGLSYVPQLRKSTRLE